MKTKIKESYFNPTIHFLPTLIFLLVNDFNLLIPAWGISLLAAISTLFYAVYAHRKLVYWHINFIEFYLTLGTLVTIASYLLTSKFSLHVADKFIFVALLIGLLIFRKPLEKSISKKMPPMMPMTNNFDELYRTVWILLTILIINISAYSVFDFASPNNINQLSTLLHWIFSLSILGFMGFETLRVLMIRAKLADEEWWPIVTEQGKIIGNIQHLTSLHDKQNFMHPIARVHLIDKCMLFLQKKSTNDLYAPNLWDTAISNHMLVGETIEQCIDRTFKSQYCLSGVKYVHLSNYTRKAARENQFAFLFVSGQLSAVDIKPCNNEAETKWWTLPQIEDNLESGIFSDNFKLEYDILKRSGLLDTEKCECPCKLKEAIYNFAMR